MQKQIADAPSCNSNTHTFDGFANQIHTLLSSDQHIEKKKILVYIPIDK